MKNPIIIAGTGCCLVDQIFPDIDFSDPALERFMSRKKGDGGISPGKLVFSEQFEAFSGMDLPASIEQISRDREKPILNVGGPSIVALIHAAQLLQGTETEVRFYGARGNDKAGEFLHDSLVRTPVILERFAVAPGATPSTIVLSDPSFHGGHGERAFINDIGTAQYVGPDDLKSDFFDADIVAFGGTALVPNLHDHLTELLAKAKDRGCRTVVNTVFDFRNEIKNPGKRWPLGHSDESYGMIDLLVTDLDEALHLSGEDNLMNAGEFFQAMGVSSFLITSGTDSTLAYSNGTFFNPMPLVAYPVSADLIQEVKAFEGGDTTGCGDNFVGGVLASLAWQMQRNNRKPDLEECLAWGTVSGGYCCFHVGGTFVEREPGEKTELIKPYFEKYRKQIGG